MQLETGEINFDIDENSLYDEMILDVDNLQESGILVESEGQTGNIARGEEAYTILDSQNYRDILLDELFEVITKKFYYIY